MTMQSNKPSSDEEPLQKIKRWWHKPHWQLLLGIIFLLVATVAVQCFFPYGRSMPNAKVGDVSVGYQSKEQLIDTLHTIYSSVDLTVVIDGKTSFKGSSVAAGIVPDYKKIAEELSEYSLAERFVPFSILSQIATSHKQVNFAIEEELFAAFADKVVEKCAKDPQNASLSFTDGQASLVSAQNGRKCSKDAIKSALKATPLLSSDSRVAISSEPVAPTLTNDMMSKQLAAANQTIQQGLTLGTPAETWVVPATELASWLTVDDRGVLQTTPDRIHAYLQAQRGSLYIDPGTTHIRVVDGVEVSRTTGTNGQGIDLDVTEKRISDVLLGRTKTRTAWVQLTVLPPQEVVSREYSPSNQGLQALITQWDKEHSGRYGIIVRDLSTAGWNAELLPDYDFVTASTYKMFLAYAVLHKVENGELTMSTTGDIGLTVRECIDEMILHSTNACATSLMNLAGWGYVHSFILSQFPSTRLDNGQNPDGEKHTTVRDEVLFMHRLYLGQLMNADNTQYLIGLFKKQIYRGGIPKGVPGITVADKVGFYNGYKHDVGIVYAPNGVYILGTMSYGGNDAEFADLSKKVYDLMKQR